MQDSGVVVVDKWRHFVPLLLTTRLNGIDRDGSEANGHRGVYDMVYGGSGWCTLYTTENMLTSTR
jgi:alpha 1,3-mannosyltransferase